MCAYGTNDLAKAANQLKMTNGAACHRDEAAFSALTELAHSDRRQSIIAVAANLGISSESCHAMLNEDLNMHRVFSKTSTDNQSSVTLTLAEA